VRIFCCLRPAILLWIDLLLLGASASLTFQFAPVLHLLWVVVIVGEGMIDIGEIDLVGSDHRFRSVALVDDTGRDVEYTDAPPVETWLAAERVVGRDDLSYCI
jgi:hypothetical protein